MTYCGVINIANDLQNKQDSNCFVCEHNSIIGDLLLLFLLFLFVLYKMEDGILG